MFHQNADRPPNKGHLYLSCGLCPELLLPSCTAHIGLYHEQSWISSFVEGGVLECCANWPFNCCSEHGPVDKSQSLLVPG